MTAVVSLRNVAKSYLRGKQQVEVLHGVDLDIARGEFLALMGPSGSGKTTMLNLIAGLDQPTSGEVIVAGERIDRLSRAALVDMARAAHRFHLPVLQPAAGADCGSERRSAVAAHQPVAQRAPQARRRLRCSWSGWPIAASTSPTSCPADSSSASPSLARWLQIRRCSCATSRRATSTGAAPRRS